MPARPHAAHGLELRQKEFPMKTEKQLARAYGELAQRLTGKRFLTASGLTRKEAAALLTQALADAAPDGLVMPFVENYRYLKPLLTGINDFTAQIIALGEKKKQKLPRNMVKK